MRGRFSFGLHRNKGRRRSRRGEMPYQNIRSGDVGQMGVRAFLHPEPPINGKGVICH